MIDITQVLGAALVIVTFVLVAFIIPLLRSKVGDETLEKALKWVKIAVQAAEMIYNESGMGATKKAYVEQFLADKGFKINEVELDAMIESAVLELKQALSA